MRMSGAKGSGDDAEVAMSPLIDAVFLLLIFFLVATISKKDNYDVELVPPISISDQKLLPDDKQAVIGIDLDGELYWQGQARTLGELHNELTLLAADDRERRVRIDADADAPFGRLSEVLDALQFRRLSNVGIRTYDDRYGR